MIKIKIEGKEINLTQDEVDNLLTKFNKDLTRKTSSL